MEKNKYQFRFLLFGQSAANLGDVLYVVALISILYEQTASIFITSMVPLVVVTAQTISGVIAPLMLEKYRLPVILRATQIAKTAVLLLLSLYYHEFSLVVVFLFAGAIAFLDGWANPARNALTPSIVSNDELVKANGLLATSDQIMHFVGWSSGGLMVSLIGSIHVLWISVALYLVASGFMLLLRASDLAKQQTDPDHSTGKTLKEGWLLLWHTSSLRVLTLMGILEGLAGAVWMSAILLVYVKQVLDKGDEWWGYINASYMLGTIMGGMLVVWLASRLNYHLRQAIFAGSIASSLMTLAFGIFHHPLAALLLSFLLGPFFQVQHVAKQTAIQQQTEQALLPKVFSAMGTIDTIVFGLSVLLISFLAEWLGVTTVYFVAAGLLAVPALLIRKLQKR